MDLSRSLVKEFADIANNKNVKEKPSIYVRGTVKMVGAKKFVQLDGSEALTPLTETVDVQDKDRVLVAIENHTATVMGNFTFPPSARKEQEAIDKAEDAQSSAGTAVNTAQDASNKADQAMAQSDSASEAATEAKKHSAEAVEAAGRAEQNATDAKEFATNAEQNANIAKDESAKAQQAVSNAQAEVNRINKEVDTVKGDIDDAFTELGEQAAEIQANKETMELHYSKKTEVSEVEASLKTEISKKVGELKTTVEQDYAAKTDVVDIEGKLQTQITQTQYGITSAASKVEKLEADTEDAQVQVNNALSSAFNAQAAADQAKEQATKTQQAADLAKQNATIAQEKATKSQQEADTARTLANAADKKLSEAKTSLAEAKENLQNIINSGGTEAQIAEAELKVRTAETAVNKALTDATEAEYAAQIAQIAANQAKEDATDAQSYATKAKAKADNAKTVATEAQKAAEKAQAEVAALTKRVTEAETKIEQNTEAISLSASKIEEIGNRKSVTETTVYWYLSQSSTELVGGTWVEGAAPAWKDGSYYWQKVLTKYFDGSTKESTPICLTGPAGRPGQVGTTGQGVSSITVEYYLSTSKTTQTGGSWMTTMPTWKTGTYLWIRNKIVYKNPSSTAYTTPYCDSSWEAAKDVADDLKNNYYNKVETDAKFKVTDESITSTVTRVETVEKTANNANTYVNNAKNNYGYQYKYDITINGEANKYYPVIFRSGNQDVMREIFINRSYSEKAPSEWDGHPTSKGIALTLKIKCNFGGWGGATYDWRIHDLNEQYGNVFAGAVNVMSGMGYAVFLRGGGTTGAIYHIYSDQKLEVTYMNGVSPKVWYNGGKDLIGSSGETYEWYAPEPRTYTKEVIDEIANRKYIQQASDAKNIAEEGKNIADEALDKAANNETQIIEAKSVITQLSNSISTLVKDQNGNSLMTQTSSGWQFNIGGIQQSIADAKQQILDAEKDIDTTNKLVNNLNGLTSDISNKTAYINITTYNSKPALLLGQPNSNFKLRITNTSIDFLDGSEAIAYISNQNLYITRAVIKDELQIGDGSGFVFKRRPNGNLGVRWEA